VPKLIPRDEYPLSDEQEALRQRIMNDVRQELIKQLAVFSEEFFLKLYPVIACPNCGITIHMGIKREGSYLITCPVCSSVMSNRLEACPTCGCLFKKEPGK